MKKYFYILFVVTIICGCNGNTSLFFKKKRNMDLRYQCPNKSDYAYRFKRKKLTTSIAYKLDSIVCKCYPNNDFDSKNALKYTSIILGYDTSFYEEDFVPRGTVQDLIDTINWGFGCFQFYENHIYHVYVMDMNCASVLFGLKDGNLIFFEDDSIIGYDWQTYINDDHKHDSKLSKAIKWMNNNSYNYTEREYQQVKEFNTKHRIKSSGYL